MTGVKMMLCLCFIFLQLTLAATQISWKNCHKNSDSIKLVNLTINPYPIVAPGSFSVEITVHTDKDVSSPLKADLSLYRKVLFGSVPIPCISGIGSCTYDDLCTLCSQCGCPLKAGDHVLTLPITIDTSSWALAGSYQAQIDIQTQSGEKGCVELNNVHIKSSK